MAGKPTQGNIKAQAAYEKSGRTLSVAEMSKKFGLHKSVIYRAAWWKAANSEQKQAAK